MKTSIAINGTNFSAEVEPRTLLVQFLRENANLTGTHTGCETSQCGACTVLIDGEPVKSCTVLAVQADGHEVTTVEGLAPAGMLHPVQAAFRDITHGKTEFHDAEVGWDYPTGWGVPIVDKLEAALP